RRGRLQEGAYQGSEEHTGPGGGQVVPRPRTAATRYAGPDLLQQPRLPPRKDGRRVHERDRVHAPLPLRRRLGRLGEGENADRFIERSGIMSIQTERGVHKYLTVAARLFLGGVFIFASIDKIAAPEPFAIAVEAYKIIPFPLINLFALIVPWLELLC